MENFLTDAITNSSHMRQMIDYSEAVFKYTVARFCHIFGVGIINGFKSSLLRTGTRPGLKLASRHNPRVTTIFGASKLLELVAEPLQENVTKHWRVKGHE